MLTDKYKHRCMQRWEIVVYILWWLMINTVCAVLFITFKCFYLCFSVLGLLMRLLQCLCWWSSWRSKRWERLLAGQTERAMAYFLQVRQQALNKTEQDLDLLCQHLTLLCPFSQIWQNNVLKQSHNILLTQKSSFDATILMSHGKMAEPLKSSCWWQVLMIES